MKILDRIPVLRDACYVMDRGYLDFIRSIDCTRRAASSSCAISTTFNSSARFATGRQDPRVAL